MQYKVIETNLKNQPAHQQKLPEKSKLKSQTGKFAQSQHPFPR